jgi:UDP-N-acetylglucosamine:LPS N-acetylglucosamine transferase
LSPCSKPFLDLVYFDAGGGHRSAALALQSVILSRGYPFEVRLVNLQELLDPLDVFRSVTGRRLQDVYNLVLARGWTLGASYLLPGMQAIIRLYHRSQVKLLTQYWQRQKPDLVVSLIPNFNRALYQSLKVTVPDAPFVTIMTDFADCPPHFWIERQPKQYLVCGTQHALNQALKVGHPPGRTFLTSGMILRPEFYDDKPIDRAAERKRLGLHPTLPTGLVLFGGEGSAMMRVIAQRLGDSPLDLQLIMICGRNKLLKARLQTLRTRNKLHVEGFVSKIPYFMRLADFFIGKPGPGSISEALHMGLPVIVERNSYTLPQERYNAEWIEEQGVGLVLKSLRSEIVNAAGHLLNPTVFGNMRGAIGKLHNRAVFEVPEILQQIADQTVRSGLPDALTST